MFRQVIITIFLLAFLIVTCSVSTASASNTSLGNWVINSHCYGDACADRCVNHTIPTDTCLYDKDSGRAVQIACVRDKKASCFSGGGYMDSFCYTEISRMSTMCESCSNNFEEVFDCNEFTRSVTWYYNCTKCKQCQGQQFLPIGQCLSNPFTSRWIEIMSPITSCGLIVLQRTYAAPVCQGDVAESGVPSGFCASSKDFKIGSRQITCHGEGNLIYNSLEEARAALDKKRGVPTAVVSLGNDGKKGKN